MISIKRNAMQCMRSVGKTVSKEKENNNTTFFKYLLIPNQS